MALKSEQPFYSTPGQNSLPPFFAETGAIVKGESPAVKRSSHLLRDPTD